MKRILLVCSVIASVFAVQLGTGTASANTQVTPAAQSINGVVGTAITATTAYTVTGISGTKVFVISPTLPRRPFDQHRHRRCLRHPNRLQRCIQLHRHSLRRRHLGHRHNHHRSLRHRHAFAWHPNSHRPRWCSHHRNHRIHFNRPRHPLFLYCPSTSRRPCI